MGNVEVDELGMVVLALPEGDREADLPYWSGGAVSDSRERLGWLKRKVVRTETPSQRYEREPRSVVVVFFEIS